MENLSRERSFLSSPYYQVSSVRTLAIFSTGRTNIFPSPICPVLPLARMIEITESTSLWFTTIMSIILGRVSTATSSPRYSSRIPFCSPLPGHLKDTHGNKTLFLEGFFYYIQFLRAYCRQNHLHTVFTPLSDSVFIFILCFSMHFNEILWSQESR